MRISPLVVASGLSMLTLRCDGGATSGGSPTSTLPTASASAAPATAPPSSSTPRPSASAAATTQGALAAEYRGTIGKDLAIVARLHREGDRIVGSYFYEKAGSDLTLTGTLAGGHLTLDELAGKTKTGAITADVAADGTLDGTWTPAKGDKALPVHLAVLPQATAARSAVIFTKKVHATKPAKGAQEKNAVCKVTLDYAEVFGLATAVEAKINAKLAPPKDVAMPDPCEHGVETTAGFEVAHNDDGLLSVRTSASIVDAEAAHPSSDESAVNALLDTGDELKLMGDVVKPTDEKMFRDAVAASVNAVAARDHWDADSKGIVVDALARATTFDLAKDGVGVYPDALPHALAAFGGRYVVPYSKLPRATGRLAALWRK